MKKSLLVISVVLLIAGLFISCNSEAAESETGLVEVKFADNSKALASSVSIPETVLPDIGQQYWWYKASKLSAGGSTGTRTTWTKIGGNNVKGLNHSVGKFSLGKWRFDLIALGTNVNPNNATNIPNYDGSNWTNTGSLVYWGSTSDAVLRSTTTSVTVPLERQPSATTGTLVLSKDIILLNNEYSETNKNWTVTATLDGNLITLPSSNVNMSTTGQKKISDNDITVNNVSEAVHTLVISVKDSDETMFSATDTFVMFGGATVTISGSLDEGMSDYIIFAGDTSSIQPDTFAAYVYKGSSSQTYSTLEAAVNAITEDGYTLGLTQDVTGSLPMHSITLEGNGHKFTLEDNISFAESTDPIKYTLTNVTLDLGGHTVTTHYGISDYYQSFGGQGFTIQNGTITSSSESQSYGLHIGWQFGVSSNGVLKNLTIDRGLNVGNASTIELRNVTINKNGSAQYNAIWCQGPSVVKLYDSTVSMTSSASGNLFAVGWGETQLPIDAGRAGTIEVYSGTYNNGSKSFAYLGNDAVAKKNLKICGGTFYADPTAYVPEGYTATATGSGTWIVASN